MTLLPGGQLTLVFIEFTRQDLQSQFDQVRSSTAISESEVTNLKHRIATLESSNRNTVALLESKTKAHDDLASDLSSKHQKTIELRKEIAELEDEVRAANSSATSANLRIQGLEQEVASLKRSNEYFESELKTKSAEHSKFRKEKATRVSELQRQHEDHTETIDGLQRTEKAVRARLSEIEQKAEDYLAQIEQVRDQASRQEENLNAELCTANRLAELMKNSADTERQRQLDLSEQLEKLSERASDEISNITTELQTAHSDKQAAEHKVAALELTIERLRAEPIPTPAPPHARLNGSTRAGSSPRTPRQGLSPSPSMSAMKGTVSYTQLVNDYHEARRERDVEKRRNEELSRQVDSMIDDLEQQRPEIQQLQAEHARLEVDSLEMSSLIENVSKERDAAKKESGRWESQTNGLIREGEILRQQLRDLSSQIKVLLLEVNARETGGEGFSPEDRARLERLARSEVDDITDYTSDTDRFISHHLVTFKNLSELHEQNVKLLRLTRQLGDRMEGEEAQLKKSQAVRDQDELLELRQKYERCRDEIKSLITQSQSYIRERDIFRRMLSHRGQLPTQRDLASVFSESVNGDGPSTPARNSMMPSTEHSPGTKDVADYTKLIKEMTSNFDSYKQEAANDRTQLKAQVSDLTSRLTNLQSDLSRRSGEVTLAVERYNMLQGNYEMIKTENVELQRRSLSASGRAAQQDIRVQQVAEDLVETKGLLESMRNETANLKAEKDFWKTVEKRLMEDSRSLVVERDRLNTLNTNLQTLLNDREHSDNETQRRLQSKVESLESEMQVLNRRLSEEAEEARRNAARKEFDAQQSQIRINDLMASLGNVREELARASATRDQLQVRVDEMTIDLRSAEQRLEVFQNRPAPNTNGRMSAAVGEPTSPVTEGQELALRVTELGRDLELAKRDLTSKEEQVQQYKSISQCSEEELNSLNQSHDQYKQEMDKIIEHKEATIKELEQNVEQFRTKLLDQEAELGALRNEKEQHSQDLQAQRTKLGNELSKVREQKERSEAAAQFYQEDLRVQADIAKQAQANYENELVKHADAAKSLHNLRAELSQIKLEAVELNTARDSAHSRLSQSEESWTEAKFRYERELVEIKTRRDDVNAQNRLLHEQLENVNVQIAKIQRARSSGAMTVSSDGASTVPLTDNMQELIKYLRREKEIVDVQFELSSQEAKRLRQQLDQTQIQLDDARLKLSQQSRANEDRERNILSHNKLVDTINELNIIRESNVTLRHEKDSAQKTLAAKLHDIEELQNQLQPLQAMVRELEDLRESQQEDMRMAHEARERFEQRYHDLLSRSDSIDPAEFESLKEKITVLGTERDELEKARAILEEQVAGFPAQTQRSMDEQKATFEESRKRIIDQAKAKARDQAAIIREKDAWITAANEEKTSLQSQLRTLQSELETANSIKIQLEQRVDEAEAAKSDSNLDVEEGQVDEAGKTAITPSQVSVLEAELDQVKTQVSDRDTQLKGLREQLASTQDRVTEIKQQLTTTKDQLSKSQMQVTDLHVSQEQQSQQTAAGNAQAVTANTKQIESLRQDLAQARNDAEALRMSASVNERAQDVQEGGEGMPSIPEQISVQVDAIKAELTARHDERVAQQDASFEQRTQQMKTKLNRVLSDKLAANKQTLADEHAEAMDQLKHEHQQEVMALNERHESELEELKRHTIDEAKSAVDGATEAHHATPAAPEKWEGNADDIRELLKSNPDVKRIMVQNVNRKLSEAHEEAERILTQKLAEAEVAAAFTREQAIHTARQQASEMEAKKQSVKVNMAQNQMRTLKVKIDFVSAAAADTPDKAVSEVWDVAKDLKPPSLPPTAPVVQAPSSTQSTPRRTPSGTGGLGASIYSAGPKSAQPAAPTIFPSLGNAGATNVFSASTDTPVAPIFNPFAKPAGTSIPSPADLVSTEPAVMEGKRIDAVVLNAERPKAQDVPTQQAAFDARKEESGPQAVRLPDTPLGTGTGIAGAQPSGIRKPPGTGLPMPSGVGRGGQSGQQRGNFHGRGRGRAIPRGGVSGIPMAGVPPGGAAGQAGQGGGQGGFNASAKQFVPQKRGLEASEHASGGDGKRQRGGHSG